jgi:FKBP-type peptidyl-prolyl cis-trans isomerase (trigger factor)
MKSKIKNINGCRRIIDIEVSRDELNRKFEQVYADIRKSARIPGFRPGHAPRDLLESYYGKKAEEEVIKRAIPEFYLKTVEEAKLNPVSAPQIDNAQLKNQILSFRATIDVRPQIRLKPYKNLKIIKKKVKIEQGQVEQVLEKLRQAKAKDTPASEKKGKENILPELNDQFAQGLGFKTMQDLKDAINKNLQADLEQNIKIDMQRQIQEQLLQRASLDVPEMLVNSQTRELTEQLKLDSMLKGEKEEEIQAKQKELEQQARKEAISRIKLSFILMEIARLESIQVKEKDLDIKIAEIAQRSGKTEQQVKQYLHKHNFIPRLKEELKVKKTIEFLLNEAKVIEEANEE